MEKEEVEPLLRLSFEKIQSIYVYEGDDNLDLAENSNLPAFDVESHINWQSHEHGKNPNLIGQVRLAGDVSKDLHPIFHLCHEPSNKILTINDLKAIIKVMEYTESFQGKKKSN